MLVKNQGIQNRARVSQSEIAAPTTKAERKQTAQSKERLAAPDPNQTVAKGTAQDFVKSTTGQKTGKSPLNVRIESQQDMNRKAYLEGSPRDCRS